VNVKLKNDALLQVENLEISTIIKEKKVPLIKGASFHIHKGEIVALVGESGCGKSLTAHALVGLLEKNCQVTGGAIYYKSKRLDERDKKDFQRIRGHEVGLLIQESLNGLNPLHTVKKHIKRTLKKHRDLPKDKKHIYELLQSVGFKDPGYILSSYPFELSGGMRQRVLLSMMLSLKPSLLIADEPTTALDTINKEKVMQLLKKLQKQYGLTVLLISHDQESVARIADRVIRMKKGGKISICS
jgi:peptide/nickel transport system ATP-binding protein